MSLIPSIGLPKGRVGQFTVDGVADGYEAFALVETAREIAPDKPVLFVARDGQRLPAIIEALAFAAPGLPVLELPAWDCLPYDRVSPGADAAARRLDALSAMIALAKKPHRAVILTTANALLQRIPPAELIEAVMGQSLDGMAAELDKMGDTLDGIEDRIVCDAWHNERQALVDARRQLVLIHRQMATLTSLFRHLDHSHRNELPDPINDMATRLSHRAHTLHHDGEQLQARTRLLQDELMAKLSEQSNQLLYILSVMTAVLLPMTIISGLFGMNVGGLPLVDTPHGFWVVTAISVVIAGIVYKIVRRLGRV
ncbi:hypothetical protein EOD07_29640 [Mesorhizobium sp. M2C.T.Ca.TU.002.02.1.1]|nr:CorA family divalent cation transporter [Mesorhizobium sp. M2C.T.Ca.TU.002.02.1.1]RUU51368.1 hypothetical protein EOD07_29640 [Mesorhizobium sp. M2C.T.Ca.TU.002.02.1.1]